MPKSFKNNSISAGTDLNGKKKKKERPPKNKSKVNKCQKQQPEYSTKNYLSQNGSEIQVTNPVKIVPQFSATDIQSEFSLLSNSNSQAEYVPISPVESVPKSEANFLPQNSRQNISINLSLPIPDMVSNIPEVVPRNFAIPITAPLEKIPKAIVKTSQRKSADTNSIKPNKEIAPKLPPTSVAPTSAMPKIPVIETIVQKAQRLSHEATARKLLAKSKHQLNTS